MLIGSGQQIDRRAAAHILATVSEQVDLVATLGQRA